MAIYFIRVPDNSIRKTMSSMTEETIIKKIYRNSADLLLSHTFAKITRSVTLEEVRARISTHITYSGDSTTLIRALRDREYGI